MKKMHLLMQQSENMLASTFNKIKEEEEERKGQKKKKNYIEGFLLANTTTFNMLDLLFWFWESPCFSNFL